MNQKRHTYDYEVDTTSGTAPAHVFRMVGAGKRVLELGCGPGSITRALANEGKCSVTGVEVDASAIELVRPHCEAVFQADLNAANWADVLAGVDPFDVVVAADVLEHLMDPWRALKRISSFITPEGYLVISLPHVGHAALSACLYAGDFNYREWGLLDRTHIRFFGLKNIESLFSEADLKIVDAAYVVKPPEETEFSDLWGTLPESVRAVFESAPHAYVYQVVLKAVPVSREGLSVPLVPPIEASAQHGLYGVAASAMNSALRASAHKIRAALGMKS